MKVPHWTSVISAGKAAIHYGSVHTGIPSVVIAALAVVIGYKILKRSARFAAEVTVIAMALAAASELGWLHW